jgi:hypothetical protein
MSETVSTRLAPGTIKYLREAAADDGVTTSSFIAELVRAEIIRRRCLSHA